MGRLGAGGSRFVKVLGGGVGVRTGIFSFCIRGKGGFFRFRLEVLWGFFIWRGVGEKYRGSVWVRR